MSELTDEQRLRNLATAAQDIRTLLETPRASEVQLREWRAHFVLDGMMRVAVIRHAAGEGLSGYMYVRHDLPASRQIGGVDTQPDEVAVFLGLDCIPDGHVDWQWQKESTILVARQSGLVAASRIG